MKDLRYFCDQRNTGPYRHPQTVMTSLGIKRTLDVPQSIADQWWFLGCTNVPDDLPDFIEEIKNFDPYRNIGWGLSKEDADRLSAARAKGGDAT